MRMKKLYSIGIVIREVHYSIHTTVDVVLRSY